MTTELGGQPPKFKTPEELKEKVDSYFEKFDQEEKKRAPTLIGLAIHLNVDRKTINNYSHKDKFFPIIKEAKCKIESWYVESLTSHYKSEDAKPIPAGIMFVLKNHYGYADKTEQTHSVDDKTIKIITNLRDSS